MTLFHGTTRSRADRIAREGWRAVDSSEIVNKVADDHGEPRAAIWADLHRWSRFVTHEGRHGWVSFAATEERAERWAQHAPEASWEALSAVWRLRNPDRAAMWTTCGDWEVWVFREMIDDPPAVISAQVPVDLLYEGGFNRVRLP